MFLSISATFISFQKGALNLVFQSSVDLLYATPERRQEEFRKHHQCVENLAVSTISTCIAVAGLPDRCQASLSTLAQSDSGPKCDDCEHKMKIKQ